MSKNGEILRYPRLDTVVMVENHIRANDGILKKRKLWESLPKKMMYQTFCVVIDYLLASNKANIDNQGLIHWIHNQRERRYYAVLDLFGRYN